MISTPIVYTDIKDAVHSALRIGSAHNKGGPLNIYMPKLGISRTSFELKLCFTISFTT